MREGTRGCAQPPSRRHCKDSWCDIVFTVQVASYERGDMGVGAATLLTPCAHFLCSAAFKLVHCHSNIQIICTMEKMHTSTQ